MPSARKPSKGTRGSPARANVELDHRVVEQIRSRRTLRSITLRLGLEQIEEARRTAATTGIPYQVVLRQWIAVGAAAAQKVRRRLKGSRTARTDAAES